MDKKAFYKITYGLYIITTSADGKDSGCVVNTLAQVTSEPARISVAINKDNYTSQQIQKSGSFSAVVLAQDVDIRLIGTFGFRSSRDTDKFAGLETQHDENGNPYVTQGTVARFACHLVDTLDVGTHLLMIGDVEDAEVLSDAEPMTYSYYHKVKKGTTPKNAPSYQKPAEK